MVVLSNLDELRDPAISKYWLKDFTREGRVGYTFGSSLPEIHFGSILDLGCNIGKTTREIKSIYPDCNVFGIDIFPFRVEIANKYLSKNRCLVADGYQMPFADGTFQAVFAMNNVLTASLEYDLGVKVLETLEEIGRVVAKKGYLLLSHDHAFTVLRKKADNIFNHQGKLWDIRSEDFMKYLHERTYEKQYGI